MWRRRLHGRTVIELSIALTELQAAVIEVEQEDERNVPEFKPKSPSGVWMFEWCYHILSQIRTHGLLRAISGQVAGWVMVGLAYTWKARLVIHWRLSPRMSPAKYATREAVCNACETQEVADDGKRYCGSCSCKRWKWSELSMKNSREGHSCPLGKHEGSKQKTGCSSCGGHTEETKGDGTEPHHDIGL